MYILKVLLYNIPILFNAPLIKVIDRTKKSHPENFIEIGAYLRVPPDPFLNLKKVIIFHETVLKVLILKLR